MGESDVPAFGPPANLSIHLAIIPAGPVDKSRGDSVVRMWVQLTTLEIVCVGVAEGHSGAAEGHSGAGCDLVSTLCKYDLRKGYLYVLS